VELDLPIVDEDSSLDEEATVMQPLRQALPWMAPDEAPPSSAPGTPGAPSPPVAPGDAPSPAALVMSTTTTSRPPGAGPTMAARSLPPEAAFWDTVAQRCRELAQEHGRRPPVVAIAVVVLLVFGLLLVRACA